MVKGIPTEKPKRLVQVLDALSDAQSKLQSWKDARTQASIELDSFIYDITLLFEEKNQIQEEYQKAQKVFREREIELQAQVESLRDEVSELKNLNQNFQKDLQSAVEDSMEIQQKMLAQKAEAAVMAQKAQMDFETALAEQRAELSRLASNHEAALQALEEQSQDHLLQARKDDHYQLEQLRVSLQLMTAERDRQDLRARTAEHELQALKMKLQKALSHAAIFGEDLPLGPKSDANFVGASGSSESPSHSSSTRSSFDGNSSAEGNSSPELMEDYLKRLGY